MCWSDRVFQRFRGQGDSLLKAAIHDETYSSLKVALRALRINKMRSFLTMLGIIIGVGAVIVMVAIGTGASGNDRPSRSPAWAPT